MSRTTRPSKPKTFSRQIIGADPLATETARRRGPAMIGTPGRRWVPWLVPVLVALVSFAAFLPTLQNEFVLWDDNKILLDNPHYRGLGWTHLKWMWTTFYASLYRPLTWMTYGLDYVLWGMNPFGYHLTSLLLHATSAVVFYFSGLRLLGLAMPSAREREGAGLYVSAACAALLFGIHPLRVEPVAWISARADVLSGVFFLLSIMAYLRCCAAPDSGPVRWRWLAGAVCLFVLSVLSKSSGMTLPAILIVLDVYPLRRLGKAGDGWFGPTARRVWYEKVPFVALALAVAPVAIFSKTQVGAAVPLEYSDPVTGVARTLFGIAFYLWKTLVPFALSPLYQLPPQLNPSDWPFLLSGTLVLVISVILLTGCRRWPAGLAAWVCYVTLLAPTSGIIQFGPQIAADRYTYLSCLGWAILGGAGLLAGWQAWKRRRIGTSTSLLIAGLAVSALAGLGVLTWKQVQVWRDSKTLWTHTLSIDPESSIAHNNLGYVLKREGKPTEAIEHFQQALRIDPAHVNAYTNLGDALLGQGKPNDAIEHYRKALRLNPALPDTHANLGVALASQGKVAEAVAQYQKALHIKPDFAEAHNNLGLALARQGNVNEAIEHLQQAVTLKPDFAEAHNNLGLALARQGRLNEAIGHYQQAVRLRPDFAQAHFHLGNALLGQDKGTEAIASYQTALGIRPTYAEAHNNWGAILMTQGRLSEAIAHFEQALQINPLFSEARRNLNAALSRKDK